MKNFCLIAAFILSTCFIYAQGPQGRAVNLPSGSNGLGSSSYGSNNILNFVKGEWVKKTNKNDLAGSYYLSNDWNTKVEIYDQENKGYKLVDCNFNVKLNQVEAMYNKEENKIYAFNSKDISKLKFGNKIFVNKENNQLFQVVYDGKVSLFKLYTTNIVLSSINPMTQQKMGKDKVDITSSYYVEKDGKVKEVKMKKSNILKLMSNKKDEVKSFIKENKLSVSEEADLFKIFQYYNSL